MDFITFIIPFFAIAGVVSLIIGLTSKSYESHHFWRNFFSIAGVAVVVVVGGMVLVYSALSALGDILKVL